MLCRNRLHLVSPKPQWSTPADAPRLGESLSPRLHWADWLLRREPRDGQLWERLLCPGLTRILFPYDEQSSLSIPSPWDLPHRCHLRRLGWRRVVSEKNIDSLIHEFSRGLGKSRDITLGESDADDEVVVLAIAELFKAVTQPDHTGGGTPGIRQRSNADRLSTLGRREVETSSD